MRIAGCIPAEASGSRQTILGVPLYLWAANNLARVLPRGDIHVDSDADDILENAASFGFGTIRRPAAPAADGSQAMLWSAAQVEADVYVQHFPSMAFLREETVRAALAHVERGAASSFAVYRQRVNSWRENDPAGGLARLPGSVGLPTTVVEGTGLYVTRRDALLSQRQRLALPCETVDLDPVERIGIDRPADLEFARTVARGLGPSSPWTRGIAALRSAKDIRFVVLDVDGVMTDGGMYYSESGDEAKRFNVKDGMAVAALRKAGIHVGFLSAGKNAKLVGSRAAHLGVEHVHVSFEKKVDVLESWRAALGLSYEQIAYIGDDVNDLGVMAKVGLAVCPSDAVDAVKRVALPLERAGGQGCVREFVDRYFGETL